MLVREEWCTTLLQEEQKFIVNETLTTCTATRISRRLINKFNKLTY